ncbi:MAG: twin-arginine translocation signal domain-containing protein [Gemmatimonadota bacterium]|nr:MAG: twin-arginine translocation signal domain-containing protein [Gemmatimonadota bacterium]
MAEEISRRDFVRGCAAAGAAAGVVGTVPEALAGQGSDESGRSTTYQDYFGDLHNHNDVGYAQGSLRRTFEIARNHLDFFAFTPHAYWPDIGQYDGNIQNKWLNGFHVARARWPEVVTLAREFDAAGEFVTILGYERHHTAEGDYHVLYPDLEGDYELIEDLAELQAFAKRRGCLLVPHHPANRLGHRGIDARWIDPAVFSLSTTGFSRRCAATRDSSI